MESFLPSDIARLVYGYLEEQECTTAAINFLETSQYLKECLIMHRKGRRFHTKILGLTLSEILDTFSEMAFLVRSQVTDPQTSPHQLIIKLASLLGITESSVKKYLNASDSLQDEDSRSSNQSSKAQEVGNRQLLLSSEKSCSKKIPPDKGLQVPEKSVTSGGLSPAVNSPCQDRISPPRIVVHDDLFDLTVLDTLLNNTILHEKIAENINKAITTSADDCESKSKAEESTIVQAALSNTEADPIFEQVICDIVSVAPEADDSTTPEETEGEGADNADGENRQSKSKERDPSDKNSSAESNQKGRSRVDEQNDEAVLSILRSQEGYLDRSGVGGDPAEKPEGRNTPTGQKPPEAAVDNTCVVQSPNKDNFATSTPLVVHPPTLIQVIPPSPVFQPGGLPSFITFTETQSSINIFGTEHRSAYRPILPKPPPEPKSNPPEVNSCDNPDISPSPVPPVLQLSPDKGLSKGGRTRGGLPRRGKRPISMEPLVPRIEKINNGNYHINLLGLNTKCLRSGKKIRGRPVARKGLSRRDAQERRTEAAEVQKDETQEGEGELVMAVEEGGEVNNETVETSPAEATLPVTDQIVSQEVGSEDPPRDQVERGVRESEMEVKESLGDRESSKTIIPDVSQNNETEKSDTDAEKTDTSIKEMSEKKETPRVQTQIPFRKKISYSSPRKGSHIRVLDFKTPVKGQNMVTRKANTSPKAISQVKRCQLKSMRRLSLFKSPVKKKPLTSWDSDLRSYVEADIPTSVGLTRTKTQPKKPGQTVTSPKSKKLFGKKTGVCETENPILDTICEEVVNSELVNLSDKENGTDATAVAVPESVLEEIENRTEVLNSSNEPVEQEFAVPKTSFVHKTPAKIEDFHPSSPVMTPVSKILKEQTTLLDNTKLLTPYLPPTPEVGSQPEDRRASTPLPVNSPSPDKHTDASGFLPDSSTEEAVATDTSAQQVLSPSQIPDKSPALGRRKKESSKTKDLKPLQTPNKFPKVVLTKTPRRSSEEEMLIQQCLQTVTNKLFSPKGITMNKENRSKLLKKGKGLSSNQTEESKSKKVKPKELVTSKGKKSDGEAKSRSTEIKLPTFEEMMKRLNKLHNSNNDSVSDDEVDTSGKLDVNQSNSNDSFPHLRVSDDESCNSVSIANKIVIRSKDGHSDSNTSKSGNKSSEKSLSLSTSKQKKKVSKSSSPRKEDYVRNSNSSGDCLFGGKPTESNERCSPLKRQFRNTTLETKAKEGNSVTLLDSSFDFGSSSEEDLRTKQPTVKDKETEVKKTLLANDKKVPRGDDKKEVSSRVKDQKKEDPTLNERNNFKKNVSEKNQAKMAEKSNELSLKNERSVVKDPRFESRNSRHKSDSRQERSSNKSSSHKRSPDYKDHRSRRYDSRRHVSPRRRRSRSRERRDRRWGKDDKKRSFREEEIRIREKERKKRELRERIERNRYKSRDEPEEVEYTPRSPECEEKKQEHFPLRSHRRSNILTLHQGKCTSSQELSSPPRAEKDSNRMNQSPCRSQPSSGNDSIQRLTGSVCTPENSQGNNKSREESQGSGGAPRDPRLSDPRVASSSSIYKSLTPLKPTLSPAVSKHRPEDKEEGEISDSETSNQAPRKVNKFKGCADCPLEKESVTTDELPAKGETLLKNVDVDRFLSLVHGSP